MRRIASRAVVATLLMAGLSVAFGLVSMTAAQAGGSCHAAATARRMSWPCRLNA